VKRAGHAPLLVALLLSTGEARAERRWDAVAWFETSLVWVDTQRTAATPIAGLLAHSRAGEPSINLAAVGGTLTLGGFHARLVAGAGTSLDGLHLATQGRPPSEPALRFLVEGYAGYTIPVGRGLTIEAGLFPSHIGYEVFPTRDNWNATHSWMATLSPFYQVGVRASLPVTANLTVKLLWLNGWDVVTQDARFRSGGAQLGWSSKKLDAAINLFAGPARARDDRSPRLFVDVWAKVTPIPLLQVAASFDAGVDILDDNRPAQPWYALGAWLRLQLRPWLAAVIRTDLVDDTGNGVVSGASQRLVELSITDEITVGPLVFRVEGRVDRSTLPTLDGRTGRQLLLLSINGGI
jgi:hypothetical protein